MPRKILPRIVAVAPGEQPMTLCVRWANGEESLIDVSGMIQSFRVYAPLRQSPELFRQVRAGEYGTDVVWTDEIDMAADTLWRLAQEQAGETMTSDAFRHWRERKAYTLDEAARALGLGYMSRLRDVVLPQALRLAFAPTVGFLVQLIKGTSLAAVIGFVELSRSAQIISSTTYKPLLAYGLAGACYFVLCFPLSRASAALERRLAARS